MSADRPVLWSVSGRALCFYKKWENWFPVFTKRGKTEFLPLSPAHRKVVVYSRRLDNWAGYLSISRKSLDVMELNFIFADDLIWSSGVKANKQTKSLLLTKNWTRTGAFNASWCCCGRKVAGPWGHGWNPNSVPLPSLVLSGVFCKCAEKPFGPPAPFYNQCGSWNYQQLPLAELSSGVSRSLLQADSATGV